MERAVIEVNTEISSTEGAQKVPGVEKGTMKINLKGKGHGEMHVNIHTGWIMRSDLDQEVSGEITFSSGENGAQEQKWPISLVTKMNVRGK